MKITRKNKNRWKFNMNVKNKMKCFYKINYKGILKE